MPYKTEWVEAELYLQHNGVNIYHAYSDDDAEEMLTHWFMTDEDGRSDDGAPKVFDERDLPSVETDDEDDTPAKMKNAIEKGYLDQDGFHKERVPKTKDTPNWGKLAAQNGGQFP